MLRTYQQPCTVLRFCGDGLIHKNSGSVSPENTINVQHEDRLFGAVWEKIAVYSKYQTQRVSKQETVLMFNQLARLLLALGLKGIFGLLVSVVTAG